MIEWRLTVSLCLDAPLIQPISREEMQENNTCFSPVQRGATSQVLRQSRPFTQQVPVHHRGQPFFRISLIFRTLRRRGRRDRLGRYGPTHPGPVLLGTSSWRLSVRCKRPFPRQQHQRFQLYGRLDAIHGTAVPGTDTTHYRAEHGIR
jgi:hypothetical protein